MAELGGKKVNLGGLSLDDGRRSGVGKNVVGGKGGKVETASSHVRLKQAFIQAIGIKQTSGLRQFHAPSIPKPRVTPPRTGA